MKKKNLFISLLVVLIASSLFMTCSDEDTTSIDSGQQINFAIGFAEKVTTRAATDDSFRSTFEPGDAIGIFIYRRNPGEESSISSNALYANNIKMIFNGNTWELEHPIYYLNDEILFDIYAYYPYQKNVVANALDYDAATEMTDLLSASALGIKRTDKQAVPLLFSHLLSLVHLSIDKTAATPDFDDTFNVFFHGVISGRYNLQTMGVSNLGKGILQMSFLDELNTEKRSCRAWIPAQQLVPDRVFSFTQTTKGKEILLETVFPTPTTLTQGGISQFQITLDTQLKQDSTYNVYDPYPKGGDYIGMVIEVYNGGRSGKVISLINLPDSKWSNNEVSWVGCVDSWDGILNLMKVQQLNNWENRFPAFYQCALYGDRWYIPGVEEAYPFLYTYVGEINQHLRRIPGGQEIDVNRSYFMSTEISPATVYKIYPRTGSTEQMPKSDSGKIRAFYEF